MDRIVEQEFHRRASETVLVQSRTWSASDPAFKAALADVTRRLDAIPVVTGVESPLMRGNADQISGDRHSAIVNFHIRGDPEKAADEIEPVVKAVDEARAAKPGLSIGGCGDAT